MKTKKLKPIECYEAEFEHGDDLKEELVTWAVENDVAYAWFQLIGEVENSLVASGYLNDEVESKKFMHKSDENSHILAMGTLSVTEEESEVHIHGSLGREQETITGCWAQNPKVFRGMTAKITVFEKLNHRSNDHEQ